MLPANVPHAALSLSPHYLYGQTFHVEGRARDPTTLEVELSARATAFEAIDTVLTYYEEGLRDPDPRIRAIHIDHVVRTIVTTRCLGGLLGSTRRASSSMILSATQERVNQTPIRL
jgi:hypothetical protein